MRGIAREADCDQTESYNSAPTSISLPLHTIRKVKILASRLESSISGLVAEQIEILVGDVETYERARQQATALLDRGFHLGGVIRTTGDEWHERRGKRNSRAVLGGQPRAAVATSTCWPMQSCSFGQDS